MKIARFHNVNSSLKFLTAVILVVMGLIVGGELTLIKNLFSIEDEAESWVNHTYQVMIGLDDMIDLIREAEFAEQSYRMTGHQDYLKQYTDILGSGKANQATDISRFKKKTDVVRQLTKDNLAQQKRLTEVENYIVQARNLQDKGTIFQKVVDLIKGMEVVEKSLLKERMIAEEATSDERKLFIYASVLFTYVVLFILLVFLLNYIHRLKVLQKNLFKTEQQLNLAISGTHTFLWDWDPSTNEWSCSPKWLTILGYGMDNLDWRFDTFKSLIHPDDVDGMMAALHEHTTKKFPYDVECRIRHKKGHYLWFNINGQALWNEDGQCTHMSGFMIDINQRKEVDRLKNEFVSNVSHELRTPLTSIRGALSLITLGAAGRLSNKAKELVNIAHKNTERLILLINDILDLEKIESGKMDFHFKEESVNQLAVQAVEATKSYAEKFDISFAVDLLKIDGKIMVDANRFTQAVVNLLSNAVKFSPPQGVVTLSLSRTQGRIRLAIKDKGQGMPREFQSRIFQKFSQADASSTKQREGTGLGLNITKTIVEHMQGKISFVSKEGKGTTFVIDFPELIELDDQITPLLPSHVGQNYRMLICEDDHYIANLINQILTKVGFKTDIAYSAEEAKLFLKKRTYAAMTLDLKLPGQDGVSLIQELRENKKTASLPIVVISVYAEEGKTQLKGNLLNVMDWLTKPIDIHRLLQNLENLPLLYHDQKPLILHVEDDEDLTGLIQIAVKDIAELIPVRTVAQARAFLAKKHVDLIIMDVGLPDGSGLDLLPLVLKKHKLTPIMILSAKEMSFDTIEKVSASLVKSRTSEEYIIQTIRKLLEKAPQRSGKEDSPEVRQEKE